MTSPSLRCCKAGCGPQGTKAIEPMQGTEPRRYHPIAARALTLMSSPARVPGFPDRSKCRREDPMALLSARALHNVLIPAPGKGERRMDARGSPAPGRATEQRKGRFPTAGAAGHRILEDALSGVALQPLSQPIGASLSPGTTVPSLPMAPGQGAGCQAVPLALSIVLAKLRLCRPLGFFSMSRLKATIPDERVESHEGLCQRRRVSIPPRATPGGQLPVGSGVEHQFSWVETHPSPEVGYLCLPAGCQQG